MYYIGLDIHKKNTQACMKNEAGKILFTGRFPSKPKVLNSFIDRLEEAGPPASFVIGSTGFCVPIYPELDTGCGRFLERTLMFSLLDALASSEIGRN